MTKFERNQIYKACELIETGRVQYSCLALTLTSNYNSDGLVQHYEALYNIVSAKSWNWANDCRERKAERIMVLQWFAEVGSEL